MSSKYNEKYIMVPMWCMNHPELSSTDKLLVGLINSLSKKKSFCYASNDYLANKLYLANRTIRSSLTKLEDLEVINRVQFKGGRAITLNRLEPKLIRLKSDENEADNSHI